MQFRTVTDQMGEQVSFAFPPRRIISLVPSQTELLADLNLIGRIIGITRFCVHPPHLRQAVTSVGGPKRFNFQVIDELQPDLIIGNKEENYEEGIRRLKVKYPVWMSEVNTLEDCLYLISETGEITGTVPAALSLVEEIRGSFGSLPEFVPGKVLYLIWRNPWMAAGRGTFIDEMLRLAGFENVLSERRYPELEIEQIRQLKAEYIFLSSEPYPFNDKHVPEVMSLFPSAKPVLVDGEMFSWFGSRLRYTPAYFRELRSQLT